jgi:hypothetical protein
MGTRAFWRSLLLRPGCGDAACCAADLAHRSALLRDGANEDFGAHMLVRERFPVRVCLLVVGGGKRRDDSGRALVARTAASSARPRWDIFAFLVRGQAVLGRGAHTVGVAAGSGLMPSGCLYARTRRMGGNIFFCFASKSYSSSDCSTLVYILVLRKKKTHKLAVPTSATKRVLVVVF